MSGHREIRSAIQYMLGTGCRRREIHMCFPPYTAVRNCFCTWRKSGVIERMPAALRGMARELGDRAAEPTAAVIDSQTVKTTERNGPSGHDAGKRIKGRKRHIALDAAGSPIAVRVQAASVQNRDGAPEVTFGMLEKAPKVRKLWTDGGYSGPKLEAALRESGLGSIIEIVQKPKDIKGFTVFCRRWVVERTFAWMSRRRRLAKDFERTPASSLAWRRLAACRFLMRRVAHGPSH